MEQAASQEWQWAQKLERGEEVDHQEILKEITARLYKYDKTTVRLDFTIVDCLFFIEAITLALRDPLIHDTNRDYITELLEQVQTHMMHLDLRFFQMIPSDDRDAVEEDVAASWKDETENVWDEESDAESDDTWHEELQDLFSTHVNKMLGIDMPIFTSILLLDTVTVALRQTISHLPRYELIQQFLMTLQTQIKTDLTTLDPHLLGLCDIYEEQDADDHTI